MNIKNLGNTNDKYNFLFSCDTAEEAVELHRILSKHARKLTCEDIERALAEVKSYRKREGIPHL